jgi:hypothetical protein
MVAGLACLPEIGDFDLLAIIGLCDEDWWVHFPLVPFYKALLRSSCSSSLIEKSFKIWGLG